MSATPITGEAGRSGGRRTARDARRRQRLGHVFNAELRRLFARGGMLGGLITVAVVSFLLGWGMTGLLALGEAQQPGEAAPLAAGAEIAAIALATLLAIVAAVSAARDTGTGLLESSLALVPRRGRLLAARWCSVALVALVVAGLVYVLGILVAALGRPGATFELSTVLIVGALNLFGVLLLALFGAGVGTVTGRPVIAILVLVGLLMVVPTGIGFILFSAPEWLRPVLSAIADALPSSLFRLGVNSATVQTEGPLAALGSLGFLAIWTVLALLASVLVLRRR